MPSDSALQRNPRLRAQAFRQFVLDDLKGRQVTRPGETAWRFYVEHDCKPSAVSVQSVFDRLVRQGILCRVAHGTYAHSMRPPSRAAVAAASNPKVLRVAEILGGRRKPTQRVIGDLGVSLPVGYTVIRKMKAQGLVRHPRHGELELTPAGEELLSKHRPESVAVDVDPFS